VEKEMSVVVGRLLSPEVIETEDGQPLTIAGMRDRAKWSFLRLQHGRSIDAEIKAAREEEKDMDTILTDLWPQQQRNVQFIMSADRLVKAVASTRHLLIPPAQVYQIAAEIIGPSKVAQDKGVVGTVTILEEIPGIKVGFQVHGGEITTRRAVSVSSFASIIQCLNPLSWVGTGNFERFGVSGEYERVLRIKKVSELRPRLERAITGAKENLKQLERLIEKSKTTKVNPEEARLVLGAFSAAYSVGLKPVDELLKRLDQEDKTKWGMAQAASWVARHGESWRATPEGQVERSRQNMATVGAAALAVKDVKATAEQCRKWLEGQKSKLAEKLLKGELP